MDATGLATLDLPFELGPDDPLLVLTGAGISAESGVPTFRGPEGLWRSFRAEELATPEAFARDPALVWQWYSWRRERVAEAEPNTAHRAIARLEQERGGIVTVVTQNVDGLHARAGSRRLVELHGSLWRTRCTTERTRREEPRVALPELPPRCPACGGLVRPDVVWFGEALAKDAIETAFAAASTARLVLVVGTSGLVEPAAQLPFVALEAGAAVVEVNPGATPLTPHATRVLRAKAAEVVPALVASLLAGVGTR